MKGGGEEERPFPSSLYPSQSSALPSPLPTATWRRGACFSKRDGGVDCVAVNLVPRYVVKTDEEEKEKVLIPKNNQYFFRPHEVKASPSHVFCLGEPENSLLSSPLSSNVFGILSPSNI